jgi:hypothetical protein
MLTATDAERRHLDFLIRNGASKAPHRDRSLLDHLWGTYRLLQERGADEDLCLAGLFHSVYGTNLYEISLPVRREEVREIIGERAERLAWLFSVLKRPDCWQVEGPRRPTADGGSIEVAPEDLRDLRIVARANNAEQMRHLPKDAPRRIQSR